MIYKSFYPLANSNTAQIFICFAKTLFNTSGVNTFIVPKSLAYVSTWKKIREYILHNLTLLIDCSKAFENANLEMCIYIIKANKTPSYKTSSFANIKNLINLDKALIQIFDIFPIGIEQDELDLGVKLVKNNEKLGKHCKNVRGAAMQNQLKQNGKYAYIGGKQINRFGIVDIKGFCDVQDSMGEILDNALLAQDIVAHITKPKNHIKIIVCIPNKTNVLILNTINQLIFENTNINLAWAILNSNLICWYAYKFIFSNSIRTMHLNTFATEKFPIPQITNSNQHIADKIIALTEEILALKAKDSAFDTSHLESEIDDLVYKLYDLNDKEMQIIQGGEK